MNLERNTLRTSRFPISLVRNGMTSRSSVSDLSLNHDLIGIPLSK